MSKANFSEVKGKELLEKLKELDSLSNRLNNAYKDRANELKEVLKDLNLQLVNNEQDIIQSKIKDDKKAEQKAISNENELLTRMTLLRQKQENILNESSSVIESKLIDLIPLICEAKKESNEYNQGVSYEIEGLSQKIKELARQKRLLHSKRHVYTTSCKDIIDRLESISKLPKRSIEHKTYEDKR